MKATELPWYYIPSWILISTPIIYLVFFTIGTVAIFVQSLQTLIKLQFFQKDHELIDAVFFILFFAPIAAVIYKNSTLYDGWRQLFFVYPMMVGLMIVGIYKAANWNKKRSLASSKKIFIQPYLKYFLLTSLGLGMLHTTYQMVKNHPHQLLFFNSIAGDNLTNKFDLDYWGLTYRQAWETLGQKYPYSCLSAKTANYPGEENYRFLGQGFRSHLELRFPKDVAEFYISNYRTQRELKKYYAGKFPYQHEVFSIKVDGTKVIGVYQDLNYEEKYQQWITEKESNESKHKENSK